MMVVWAISHDWSCDLQADSMLNLLKANHYKLLCSHAETSNGPRPSSQFAEYINTATDKHVSVGYEFDYPLPERTSTLENPLPECALLWQV